MSKRKKLIVLFYIAILIQKCQSACNDGYKETSNSSCVDINECEIFGTCAQICKNLNGGYICKCEEDFIMSTEDNTRCQLIDPNWRLIYSTVEKEIGYYDCLSNDVGKNLTEIVSPLEKVNWLPPQQRTPSTAALSLDAKSEVIYYVTRQDWGYGPVVKAKTLNSTLNYTEVLVETGLYVVNGLAFDWITGNIYVTDGYTNSIIVCRTVGEIFCANLYHDNKAKPQDIKLHPLHGLMFWIDSRQFLMKSGMDGSDPKPIISLEEKNSDGLSCLSVDMTTSRVYFCDASGTQIWSVRTDGTDGKQSINVIANGAAAKIRVRDIGILGDRLFWNTFHEIQSVDKFTGNKKITHLSDPKKKFSRISLYHLTNQPLNRTNPCSEAGCSYICTLSPDPSNHRCHCPEGMKLANNRKTCEEDLLNTPQLVIAINNTLRFMTIGSVGRTSFRSVTLPNITTITALTYNPLNLSIIFSDTSPAKIYEYFLDTGRLDTILEDGVESVVELEFDFIGRNLYWLDSEKLTLETISFFTKKRMTLMKNLTTATDFHVVPELGLIFLSMFENNAAWIYKMLLDGSHKDNILRENRRRPGALAYDNVKGVLFWADHGQGSIDLVSIDGERSNSYLSVGSSSPSDIVMFNGIVYWFDTTFKDLKAVNLPEIPVRIAVADFGVLDVKSAKLVVAYRDPIKLKNIKENHECSLDSKNFTRCSHFCFSTSEGFRGKCVCQENFNLLEDGKTCEYITSVRTEASDGINLWAIFAFGAAVAFSAFLCLFYSFYTWFRRKFKVITNREFQEFLNGKSSEDIEKYEDFSIFGAKYDADQYEVDYKKIKILSQNIIGSGNFGRVYRAKIPKFEKEAAVKTVRNSDPAKTIIAVRTLIREIKIMSYVGEHANIIQFLGAYTKDLQMGIIWVITEYCAKGSLLTYLRDDLRQRNPLNVEELYRISGDIANGMHYLAMKKVIHADLSARNILLDENGKAKITDFGLSRTLERYTNEYAKESNEPLPWAWMAIESLEDRVFSLKSDVWSLGVTFWEIFSLGMSPYAGRNWDERFTKELREGKRLLKPEKATLQVYENILTCWHVDPAFRPNPENFKVFFHSFVKNEK